ncbi:MAG: S41 family peptidase [Bacteroidota bacterium]
MKKYIFLFIAAISFFGFALIPTDQTPLWIRYSAISPDGKTIVFSYKGDIYKVDAKGGTAALLTLSEGHDFMPVWSPDGQNIAFASDRNGNYDIYLMASSGGTAKRLTYYSMNDYPSCFSPDGSTVYFYSSRMDAAKCELFPSNQLPELYSVSVKGGKELQVLTTPAEYARWDKKGTRLLFHDKKGYEDTWRKHHTSAIARDIWMYSKPDNKYTLLTTFDGEDRNPVWSNIENEAFYLSEKSGSFNVWKFNVSNPAEAVQVTKFEKNPVRFLSAANDGTLCFGYDGEIYTKSGNAEPQKVNIQINTDERYTAEKIEVLTSGATDMDVSPNSKEVVFVVRGEVFVTSVEGGITKRITNTPQQERSVGFSPDGRSILYAGERNNIWGLYQTSLTRPEETQFFNSTVLKEEPILVGATEAFQPRYSPDGTEVAFIEERTAIKIINLKTKAIRTLMEADKNYSYSDGDQWFDWSPDGKYIVTQYLEQNSWLQQLALIETSGNGKTINLTQSGFENYGGKWMMNGKMMLWFSSRHGMKNHQNQGTQSDVYGLFFTQESYDRFKLSKEDFAALKEKEEVEKSKNKTSDKTKTDTKTEPAKTPELLKIDFNNLDDRKVRLTQNSSDLADAVLSNDGEQLFYLSQFEKGYDLWVTKLREHETKMLVKLGADRIGAFRIDKDGKNLFVLADGALYKINIDKGDKKEVSFKAEMNLNTSAERAYMFEHAWRVVQKKFYVTDLQKTDWNYYKQVYSKFLPHVNNNRDFAEVLSEMLGELNASHTGGKYSPKTQNTDETAALGAFYDESFTGNGVKIMEIIDKSPLIKASSQIKAGTIIEKIDGVELTPEMSIYQLLNRKAGKYTLLSLYDDQTKKRWEETVKPIKIGDENELLYQRWIKIKQKETENLSKGRLGYVHIRAMNDASYRVLYEDALGKYSGKEALIVDTRFNGGGWLHDELVTFLSGKKYMDFVPRERKIGVEPQYKWNKPSIVLIGEGNYSDAQMFPYSYRALGIGKMVGMPVPGTGTAVWWETMQDPTMVFGVPQVGVVDLNGKYLENQQIEPDYKVMNEPVAVSCSRDQQLEKAVEVLLKQLDGK